MPRGERRRDLLTDGRLPTRWAYGVSGLPTAPLPLYAERSGVRPYDTAATRGEAPHRYAEKVIVCTCGPSVRPTPLEIARLGVASG